MQEQSEERAHNEPSQNDEQSFDLASEGWRIPGEGVTILRRLIEGNRRFVAGELEHPHQNEDTRVDLSRGQNPDLILVACSDSRVEPAAIFDLGLGDVFTIQNAGEVVIAPGQNESLDIASIEYMVQSYVDKGRCGVLMVLGHTNCGAISATVEAGEDGSSGSPHLDLLVNTVRANIPPEVLNDPGEHLERAVKANASAVLNSILEHSQIVRDAIDSDNLILVQATYDIHTGEVQYINGMENLKIDP